MLRYRPSTLLALLLLLASPHIAQADETQALFTVGTATDADSGEALYRELHLCTEDRLSCTVEYRDMEEVLIAHKTLDYRARLHGPAVVMRDLRTGKEHQVPVQQDADVVVDSGFDNYVRLRWSDLQNGKELSFPLKVLTLDRPVRMRAAVLEQDCDAQHLCLTVEVDSWLLGLLADPISLRYSRSDQRLLYFGGVSNIKSAEGDSQVVEIHYDYSVVATPASSTAL